jgi:hypothetical protein
MNAAEFESGLTYAALGDEAAAEGKAKEKPHP